MRRSALLGLLLPLLASVATAQPHCARTRAGPGAGAQLARLAAVMAHGRFVAYEPTSLRIVNGQVEAADPQSIRADLKTLRSHFDGLITYDAVHGVEAVPGIAAELGFRALIIGVWDATDRAQLEAALAAAARFPQLVVGLSLGNETLFGQRTSIAALVGTLATVRARDPRLALSTTEPFHMFEKPEAAALLDQLDFMLVNVHPAFQPWFHDATDATAAQFVVNVMDDLGQRFCGPIVVKETGVPTGPASAVFSPERQAGFYAQLRRRLPPTPHRAFAYFSAFDAPWRASDAGPVAGAATGPEEAFWGLYDSERRPKPAARALPPL